MPRTVTAKQLVAELAACTVCGKEHKPRSRAGYAPSYEAPDGHAYRTRLLELTGRSSVSFLDMLRQLIKEM